MPTPLWEIFSSGRRLELLGLGIRVLPLPTNMSYETAFDDESHTLSRAMRHEYDDAEIPLSHPERLFSTPFDAVPPMERPLAMATRLLTACADNSSVRLLCLGEQAGCLLRFRHLVQIWIRLPVTTQRAMMAQGLRPHGNRWLTAANGMRPALMDLASKKHDQTLTMSEVASLPDGRKELDPFAKWLGKTSKCKRGWWIRGTVLCRRANIYTCPLLSQCSWPTPSASAATTGGSTPRSMTTVHVDSESTSVFNYFLWTRRDPEELRSRRQGIDSQRVTK